MRLNEGLPKLLWRMSRVVSFTYLYQYFGLTVFFSFWSFTVRRTLLMQSGKNDLKTIVSIDFEQLGPRYSS